LIQIKPGRGGTREIGMLVLDAVLHNRLPDLAGTLGISMITAVRTSIFTKVEGLTERTMGCFP